MVAMMRARCDSTHLNPARGVEIKSIACHVGVCVRRDAVPQMSSRISTSHRLSSLHPSTYTYSFGVLALQPIMNQDQEYRDPYAQDVYDHDQHHNTQPNYTDASSSAFDQSNNHHEAFVTTNQSSEKMINDSYPENTLRAQPGRQGIRAPPKSWAEIGPPPRSTGILRMWRKDERGPQWFRVGLPTSLHPY